MLALERVERVCWKDGGEGRRRREKWEHGV